ncbi:hypothetical protein [Sphingomonas sp.]|uniref:hypothetical protein n=1 Tax=Sphingomonas sp. TaxID=28214 RepID=UPI001D737FED|nr:hypothetical protein [Sphingomonas sp.]MBX9796771.1 hypothetical protein [Sphingomonas sp.]
MPTLAEIEREYRELSARITYAGFSHDVLPEDERRLEQLGQWRIELTAPDFQAASAALVAR